MSAAPDYQIPEPGDPCAMERNSADLGSVLYRMATDVPAHLESFPDRSDAVQLLVMLREARTKLAELEAFAEAECVKRFGKGKHEVEGWQVEVKGGNGWKEWRHDELAFALCRPLAVDPATGEIIPEVVQIIDEVRSRLLAAARPDWRTTVLKQYGLSAGDYATWTPSRRTVMLTPDTDAAA